MSEDRKHQVRVAKIEAESVVDRVVAMMLSKDCDAGWTGNHPLGSFHDLQGFQPDRSGASGMSKVWEQTFMLQEWPERYHKARDMLAKLKGSYREAVLIDRLCRVRLRRIGGGKMVRRLDDGEVAQFTDEDIAEVLGLTEANFRQRVCRGYRGLILLCAPDLRH